MLPHYPLPWGDSPPLFSDLLSATPFDASRPSPSLNVNPSIAPAYGGPLISCLPESAKLSDEQLDGDSRQITPIFVPGVQDHYTGLKELPSVASKLQGLAMAPPPGLKEMPRECLVVSKPPEIPRHDSQKLESLIWLYLQSSKGDDSSQLSLPLTSETASSAAELTDSASDSAAARTSDESSQPASQSVDGTSSESASEEFAPPPICLPVLAGNAPSCGSIGHPYTCAEACKYARKKRGFKDGLACTRCHLCVWLHKRHPTSSKSAAAKEDVKEDDSA
jgi:hypothetical protein